MYDCDVCLSAGSVNRWGYCEICGEDFEEQESQVIGRDFKAAAAVDDDLNEVLAGMGRDAA